MSLFQNGNFRSAVKIVTRFGRRVQSAQRSTWMMIGAIIGLFIGAVFLSTIGAMINEAFATGGWTVGLVAGGYLGAKVGEYCHRKASGPGE